MSEVGLSLMRVLLGTFLFAESFLSKAFLTELHGNGKEEAFVLRPLQALQKSRI